MQLLNKIFKFYFLINFFLKWMIIIKKISNEQTIKKKKKLLKSKPKKTKDNIKFFFLASGLLFK